MSHAHSDPILHGHLLIVAFTDFPGYLHRYYFDILLQACSLYFGCTTKLISGSVWAEELGER